MYVLYAICFMLYVSFLRNIAICCMHIARVSIHRRCYMHVYVPEVSAYDTAAFSLLGAERNWTSRRCHSRARQWAVCGRAHSGEPRAPRGRSRATARGAPAAVPSSRRISMSSTSSSTSQRRAMTWCQGVDPPPMSTRPAPPVRVGVPISPKSD